MYGYPPYPMMYPQQQPQLEREFIEKGIKIAERLQNRDRTMKERDERMKAKKRDEERQQAVAARARTLTAIEWFILGIVSYPFVGPLYQLALNHVLVMAK